jgi:NADH-quinone oxidoreductase subunit H
MIVMVLVPILLTVLYYQLVERWVIGWIQVRKGPNRVGWKGVLQPIADAIKLLMKEQIVPVGANKALFLLAPIISVAPALAAWAIVPFTPTWVIADVDAAILVMLAMTSMGIYGVIIAAGLELEVRVPRRHARRRADGLVRARHGLRPRGRAHGRAEHAAVGDRRAPGRSYGLPRVVLAAALPLFVIHYIAGLAETNRHPFDVAEGESEIVAGFHVEYSE